MAEGKKQKQKLSGKEWVIVIAAAVICFLHCSAQGLVSAVIPSLGEIGISKSLLGVAVTVSSLVAAVLGMLAGKIIDKITARGTLFIASIAAAGYGVMLGLVNNALLLFVAQLFMSFLATLGTYSVAASLLSEHLGSRMGPVYGLVAGIANLGNTFVSLVMGRAVPAFGWRPTVTFIGLGVAVICIVLNLVFLGGKKLSEEERAALKAAKQKKDTSSEPGYTLKEAMKTASFWLFAGGMFLGAMLFTGIGLFAIDFFMIQGGLEYKAATNFMAVATLFGALVVMFGGVITNKLGGRGLMFLMFGAFTVGAILLTYVYPATLIALVGYVAVCLTACVRPLNTVPGLVLPEMFGRKDFNSISNFGFSFYALGAGLSSTLIGVLADVTGGNYTVAFTVLAVASVAALLLLLMAIKTAPMKKEAAEPIEEKAE